MAGYWQRPDETAKVMTADGFFKTGDIGIMNEQGYVKIVDRKKDIYKAHAMEGVSWDGGVIDEYADCKPGTFDAHIRPSLADRRGWLWLIGVPDVDGPAQVEYERFYDIASKHNDPEWAAFHWASADILPADEIASAKRMMDPRLFEQEMLGKFVLPADVRLRILIRRSC